MANNKFYGYTPKTSKPTKSKGKAWSGEDEGSAYEEIGNRLDRVNPSEFRKGMDYELVELGCSRLAESTPEEREKSTETVLKNLEGHGGYYTSLITYETEYRNRSTKPSFATWLKDQDEIKMKEIQNPFKTGKMKDATHKNDKMTEPKYKKEDYTVAFETTKLKEAIKAKLRSKLYEVKDKDEDEPEDEEVTDTKAKKGAAKAERGMARFEREEKAIDELLFGKPKGDEEVSEENPGKGSLLFLKDKFLDVYKQNKDVEAYKKAIILPDAIIKKLEKHADIFSKLGNKVSANDMKGKDLPETIKKLEVRKTSIKKEREEEQAEVGKQRNEIASTDMSRANHLRLLEIIRENGISLREGAESIKTYYEIAKTAYLEGLSKGLRL
tara:strand:- start:35 stop:1183 length:1149 start_codon:yes stop_codon:yes gene_type:complete